MITTKVNSFHFLIFICEDSLSFLLSSYRSDTEIIAFVFFNKAVLLQSLMHAGVLTSPTTLDAFINAFNEDALRSMIDVG